MVRGIRKDVTVPGKKHFHKMEINVGPFARRVPIAVEVVPDSAKAIYRNGFLYVTFEKGSSKQQSRRQIVVDR
jgi:HSP20 family molecular chaperone IbpA